MENMEVNFFNNKILISDFKEIGCFYKIVEWECGVGARERQREPS